MQYLEFEKLTKRFFELAKNKLGFPTSFLSANQEFINNEVLGIKPNSLSSILLNDVGDPFKASETWALEVKDYEVKIIKTIAKHLGMPAESARGYITAGGTEGNEACIRWAKRYLIKQYSNKLKHARKLQNIYGDKIKQCTVSHAMLSWHNKRNYQQQIAAQITRPTLVFALEHTHYSLYKIADALELNVLPVASNKNGQISIEDFKAKIDMHVARSPYNPLIVIANIGTTVYGAIDDAKSMREVLDAHVNKPKYILHMDGAMLGLLLPVLKPFGDVDNYFAYADTISMSFHKYLGVSQPSGLALTSSKLIEPSMVEYAGNISDITVSGSRSGLNVLLVYNVIFYALELDKDNTKLQALVAGDLAKVQWCYDKLVTKFGADNIFYNPLQFNIILPKPDDELVKKYQLMVKGEQAIICVLNNVTTELVDNFIDELSNSLEEISMRKNTNNANNRNNWWGGQSVWGAAEGKELKNNELSSIAILEEKHVAAATELFADCFCKYEPLVKHLGISKTEFWPLAAEIMHKAALDGLSVVAVDGSGHVTGCAIAENFHTPIQLYPNDKLQPIFALFEQLAEPVTNLYLPKDTVVHIWITAVAENAHGQGLSTRLNNACVMRALEKQFKYVYCEFTNPINERIMQYYPENLKLNTIQLKDFIWQDSKPFAALEGEVNAYVTTVAPFIRLSQITDVVASATSSGIGGGEDKSTVKATRKPA